MARPRAKLLMPEAVAGLVRSMHPHLKKKVRAAFQTILTDPAAGKELREELSGLRSFRLGRYRVIYRSEDGKDIEIVAVGPRERIYEDTYRLLTKKEK